MSSLEKHLTNPDGISEVKKIQFGIFSPEMIKDGSVCEIFLPDTYDGLEPKNNGVLDARMGILDRGKLCPTDMLDQESCPGYFGSVELAQKMYNIIYIPYLQKIMRCVCYRCGNVLINKSSPDVLKALGKKTGKARFKTIYDLSTKVKRCEHNDGCMTMQPNRYSKITTEKMKDKESPLKIFADFPDSVVKDTGMARQQLITPEMCYRIFRSISDEDVEFIGFNPKYSRPEWMLFSTIPVPPPAIRPSVRQDNNTRAEDDLTYALSHIVKYNKTLQDKMTADSVKTVMDSQEGLLQFTVFAYVDNNIPKIGKFNHRSSRRPLKSIKQRQSGKEGHMRGNIMGKRVDYSARSVISVNPNIKIDQFGVPLVIAMNLTMPEKVNDYNIKRLYQLVRNGPSKYPGAKSIMKLQPDGTYLEFRLKYVDTATITLEKGDIVNRHLQDGDPALFNRQPSLHRMSMLCHYIKVVKSNTLQLNLLVCKPYNADFDGDEMNMHLPRSYMTAVELEKLALVPTQIISPASCSPIMPIVQDTMIGAFLLTNEKTRLTKEQICNIIMFDENFNGVFPPADEVIDGVEYWRGSTVYSMILPDITYTDFKTINIVNGKIVPFKKSNGSQSWGRLDKNNLRSKLIQTVYNMYGRHATQRFMDSTQYLITRWMIEHSFSLGLSDYLITKDFRTDMNKMITNAIEKSNELIRKAEKGEYEPNITDKLRVKLFEQEMFSILSNSFNDITNKLVKTIPASNALNQSFASGATKGTSTHQSQSMAILGQSDIYGERIPDAFDFRPLPHFPKGDRGASARGFIIHSFTDGLTPIEFFYHAMTSRIGTINTAITTAESGYISRKLIKTMEDYKIEYDGTVRSANGTIIQFKYGDDSFDPTKLELQPLKLIEYSDPEMTHYFDFGDDPDWETLLYKKTATEFRKMKVEEITTALNDELNKLKEMRKNLREFCFVNSELTSVNIYAPFNPYRFIYAGNKKFGGGKKCDLTPIEIISSVNELIEKIDKTTKYSNYLVEALIRTYLSSKQVIVYNKMNKASFKYVLDTIYEKILTGYIQPGEMVGIVSAQSLGENSTQLVLNAFHTVGASDKAVELTTGLPRLKEILERSKSIRTPSMNIYVKEPYCDSNDKVSELATEFTYTKVSDIVISTEIIYEREDVEMSEEEAFMSSFEVFEKILGIEGMDDEEASPWSLRLKFDQEALMNRNIRISEVQNSIMKCSEDHKSIKISFSDDNAGVLMLKLKIRDLEEGEDNIDFLRALSKRILDMTLRGVKDVMKTAVMAVNKVKYMEDGSGITEKVWAINTDGSNLYEVMRHDMVDTTRTVSNHIPEILEIFGVEAARYKLIEELIAVYGDGINYRHIELLADAMTNKGIITPTNRHGINKATDRGPISKASFEEVADTMVQSSVFAEQDKMKGVSANIMMGQLIKGGTNSFDVLLDESKIFGLKDPYTEAIEGGGAAGGIVDTDDLEKYIEGEMTDMTKDADFEFGFDPSQIRRRPVVDFSETITSSGAGGVEEESKDSD